MGVVRGDFEKVLAVQQGPRAARLSADVPDVGAPLRLLAPALRAWGDVFGKLAATGTDYTRRKNMAEMEMTNERAKWKSAQSALSDVEERGAAWKTKMEAGPLSREDQSQYEAWSMERDAAAQAVKRAQGRVNMAEQRWKKTGFFGWKGTPDWTNEGMGPN